MFMARKIYPSYNDYFSLFTTIMKDPTYSPHHCSCWASRHRTDWLSRVMICRQNWESEPESSFLTVLTEGQGKKSSRCNLQPEITH